MSGPSFDDFVERFFYGWPAFSEESDLTWAPRVDVNETEKEFIIDAELPGMEKKDIHVGVENDMLKITGERKDERKSENGNYSRRERHYGKFERTFALPDTVDAEKVNAEFKNGLLTITLPKTEKAKPKEIAVEVK
jgi:HSP20 family protein